MNFHLNDKQKIFLITGIPTFFIWLYNASFYIRIYLLRGNVSDFIQVTIIQPLPFGPYWGFDRYISQAGAPIFITLIFMTWVGSLIGFFLFKDYGKKNVK